MARRSKSQRTQGVVAPSRGPDWLRPVLLVAAGAYLVSIFLSAVTPKWPDRVLPRVPRYFTQVACLFPHAARRTIDYRLEVWRCDLGEFVEHDTRALFPMHADDKESRFHRVGHFYRKHRAVMRALERYVVLRERAADPHAAIGGIRVVSLRIPFPEVGEPAPRWEIKPLDHYPADQRRDWYFTPISRRRIFCTGGDPDAAEARDEAEARYAGNGGPWTG